MPTPAWCVPASHGEHCSASPVLLRASSPRLPTPQLMQYAEPFWPWCCPAGQAVHDAASTASEYQPGAQIVQVWSDASVALAETRDPTAHRVLGRQRARPAPRWCWPGGHAAHSTRPLLAWSFYTHWNNP